MAWKRAGSAIQSDLMRTMCRELLCVGESGVICLVLRLREGGWVVCCCCLSQGI